MIELIRYIITTKNNENIIEGCLDSIIKQNENQTPKITIVDDNSSDNTVLLIKKKYPFVEIINCTENKGPSANRNKAIFLHNEKYFIFMDSDATLSPEWSLTAFKFLESNPKVGILGGKILGADGNLQSAGGEFHCGGTGWLVDDNYYEKKDRYCFWLPSSTFIVRSNVIKKIGGFDEDYVYLYEDLDICWRVWLNGFFVYFNSDLLSSHIMSKTTNTEYSLAYKTYLSKRNKITTIVKNSDLVFLIITFPVILFIIFGEILLLKNKYQILRGNLSFFMNFFKILKKRSKNLKNIDKKVFKNQKKMYYNNHIRFIRMCLKI